MKLLVLTACYISYENYLHSYKYMIDSCDKNNIDLKVYGEFLDKYLGWIEIKIKGQLDYLYKVREDYSHVLYTDGRDAFFIKDLEFIKDRYEFLGKPSLLVSCSEDPQWKSNKITVMESMRYFPEVKYRYIHSGGYIGEIDTVIHTLECLYNLSGDFGDDSHIWFKGWKEGWLTPRLDWNQDIFQVMQNLGEINKDSCIVHYAGGFSDPKDGKLNIMKQLYERMYA